jgi:hypothetical protein
LKTLLTSVLLALSLTSISANAAVSEVDKHSFTKLTQCAVIADLERKPLKIRQYNNRADSIYSSKGPVDKRMLDNAVNNNTYTFATGIKKMGTAKRNQAMKRCDLL